MFLYYCQCLQQQFFYSTDSLQLIPQVPSNFFAHSHQHVVNNYKCTQYIQYIYIYIYTYTIYSCSHNQLEVLWAVSMLLFWQVFCYVLSNSVSINSISSRINLLLGLHGLFLWIMVWILGNSQKSPHIMVLFDIPLWILLNM